MIYSKIPDVLVEVLLQYQQKMQNNGVDVQEEQEAQKDVAE